MNTTGKDTPDTKARPAGARAPRPRAAARPAGTATSSGYAAARTKFEARAQRWLLERPGRVMQMPDDLRPVTALGVPCQTCGNLVYRDRDAGHTIEWTPKRPGDGAGHWAAGLTAWCGKKKP